MNTVCFLPFEQPITHISPKSPRHRTDGRTLLFVQGLFIYVIYLFTRLKRRRHT